MGKVVHVNNVGKGGSKIKELQAACPEVDIQFPTKNSEKQDIITLRGDKGLVKVHMFPNIYFTCAKKSLSLSGR